MGRWCTAVCANQYLHSSHHSPKSPASGKSQHTLHNLHQCFINFLYHQNDKIWYCNQNHDQCRSKLRYLWCWLEQCLLGFRLDCVVNILLSAHNCKYIVHNCKFIGGSDGDPIPLSGDACQEVALTAQRTLPLAARIVIVIFVIVIKTVINYSTSKFHK